MTNILPVRVETYDDAVILYTDETEAVWDVVQSVAGIVPPMVLANIARTAHEFHENGGVSAAAALDAACDDIPPHAPIALLRLGADEAMALGVALQRLGQSLLMGGDAA